MVEGIPKKVSIRKISAIQLKKFYKKGFQLYFIHTSYFLEGKGPRIEDYWLLQEFKYFFLDEEPGLPPKRDIDFTINLVPGEALVYKVLYRMSTL